MTPRQVELMAFLRQRELAGGGTPSFAEMAAHLGVASKSRVGLILFALERAELISRQIGRPRSIKIVGLSEYARGYHDGYAAAQAERKTAA